MTDEWILDVLADLKVFAENNDLPFLAESLEDARCLAGIELAVRAFPADPTRGPEALRTAHRARAISLARAAGSTKGFGS